jgi:hypothetical protein
MAEHADLVVADKDDPAVTVLEFRNFCDEFFRHLRCTLAFHPVAAPPSGADDFPCWFCRLRESEVPDSAWQPMHLAQNRAMRDRGSAPVNF